MKKEFLQIRKELMDIVRDIHMHSEQMSAIARYVEKNYVSKTWLDIQTEIQSEVMAQKMVKDGMEGKPIVDNDETLSILSRFNVNSDKGQAVVDTLKKSLKSDGPIGRLYSKTDIENEKKFRDEIEMKQILGKSSKTQVNVEYFKPGGKFYSSNEYITSITAFDFPALNSELRESEFFISGMYYIILASDGKSWGKRLYSPTI